MGVMKRYLFEQMEEDCNEDDDDYCEWESDENYEPDENEIFEEEMERRTEYDWAIDAKGCWLLAINEIRLWGLITGKYDPIAGEKDYRWIW